MNEFRDKARPAELGDPATDRPLTLRVHPDDDPRDPNARRVVRVAQRFDGWPWVHVTGPDSGCLVEHHDVERWPYTNHALASAAFRDVDEHRTMTWDGSVARCLCGVSTRPGHFLTRTGANTWHRHHRGQAAQDVERGDLDVTAFKGGVS